MADELDTVHVDEYGRTHYEQRGGVLTLDDYVEIAETHRRLEDEAILRANRYLFVDTNAVRGWPYRPLATSARGALCVTWTQRRPTRR